MLSYPEDAIKDMYNSLVEESDRSETELNLLLTLRGVVKP